jgi:hypothetical protein
VVFSCTIAFRSDTDVTATEVQTLFAAGTNNAFSGFTSTLAGFVNGSNESGRVAFNASTVLPFFDNTPYIGAVRDGNDNWWVGWTCGLAAGSTC